jgi:hypothetical protein
MSNQEYVTKDLYLTVYLLSIGNDPILRKEGSDDRFAFGFENSDNLQNEIKKFYERCAQVEPMQFCVSLKQLKSRMYNFQD